MIQKEQAREQARLILETAQSEATSKSNTIVAKAKQVVRKAKRESDERRKAAEQAADEIQSQARLSAELKVRNLSNRVNEDIRSAVTNICNNLLTSMDGSEIDVGLDDRDYRRLNLLQPRSRPQPLQRNDIKSKFPSALPTNRD